MELNINGSLEIVFNCHFSVWCHLTDPNSWHFHKKKRKAIYVVNNCSFLIALLNSEK